MNELDTDASADNCLDLLRLLSNVGEHSRPSRYGIVDRELDAMAADLAITAALWAAISRRPLNVRFFSSVVKIRASLEQRRDAPLAEPPWWARVRGLYEAMTNRPEQPGDDEPAIEAQDDEVPAGDVFKSR